MSGQILSGKARAIREQILSMQYQSHGSCLGSCLSCVEILTALYFSTLHLEPENPDLSHQDVFILSKGHAAAALYATLKVSGMLKAEAAATYGKNGSRLSFHATAGSAPTVQVSTGSLGHGLGVGIGMAISGKAAIFPRRVYVLLGDGECDEGSVWEAALFASHNHIGNLTAIIDANKIQALGKTREVLNLEPLKLKWQAFGWQAVEIDGHDIQSLQAELESQSGANQPKAIIARTVKGKGVPFMENELAWHYKTLDINLYKKAMRELI